jgi:putative molybdopterin biosynthesis protein
MEISTGAPLPKGADSVVMVEHAAAMGNSVSIYRAVSPGENVAQKGSEIKRGAVILKAGQKLTPSMLGTIAAVGFRKVKVFRKPRVAVISTGAELKPPGSRLRRGQVYDVNGPTICSAVEECGGEARYWGIVPDRKSQIAGLVGRALLSSDLVLISGGSSAGAGDVVPAAVNSLGRPGVVVHGLALKPGKPTFIAVVRGKPIFGLPGYPVSALMIFYKLVTPYLRELAGLPPLEEKTALAKLSKKVLSARGRQEFIPVKLMRKRGELTATPILKGSGAITSLSTADGYFEVPLEKEIVHEGEIVRVSLLRGGELA